MSTTVTYKGNTLTTATNQTRVLETAGKYMEDDVTIVDVTSSPSLQSKSKSYTPTETAQSETVICDSGYDGLSQVSVNVGAISSSYVGSGITRRSSSDLRFQDKIENGVFVGKNANAPAGYYAEDATLLMPKATWPSVTTISNTPVISIDNSGLITARGSAAGSVIASTGGYQLPDTGPTYNVSVSNTLQLTARTSSDLTASGATVTAPSGYYASAATKTVASGTAGTPTATKGTVSNHAVSVTPSVTNTAGYISGGTHNGTAVSVSASELVSGTYSVTSSGTKDVTNYASASVPAISLPTSAVVSTHTGTKKGSVRSDGLATQYLNIPTGFNDTAQYYEVEPVDLDTKSITENGTYYAYMDSLDGYSAVTVNVSGGGGGSDATYGVAYKTLTSASTSITFTGLDGEPTSFVMLSGSELGTGASPFKVASVVYDGTSDIGQIITNTNNAQVTYDSTDFSHSYSNGTLTITSTSPQFQAVEYYLNYSYNGTSANVKTQDVQVGSGATSITFTGLEDEPFCWSCIFKSNFGTSSGYQRVICVSYNTDDDCVGMEMDSSAKFAPSDWSYSYNNGSLTITSYSTSRGGYFHQPGYYQLTYVVSGDQSLQTKTITPTTSTQNVTADTGYTALKKVVVNPIPSSYVQPTTTVGATTYRASTSSQTISSGTYHSAAATIAAVSQTNLSADNIKSGTTISISNGQSNLWSVTGTYSGGGGGSANIATATMTNSSNQNTSISFTLPSGRTPKAFFARLTSQIARSSNSRYYYVFDMRWDGSSTGGVAGNTFYMYNGTLTNVTSGYSYSQSGTTFTLSSTGSRSASPGSFYNGTYELVYVY